jgi:hypothetical protein
MFTDSAVAFKFEGENEENKAEDDKNGDLDDVVDVSVLTFGSQVILNSVSILRIRPEECLSKQLIKGADHVLAQLLIVRDLFDEGDRCKDFRDKFVAGPVLLDFRL